MSDQLPTLRKIDRRILEILESGGYELATLDIMDRLNAGKRWWSCISFGGLYTASDRLVDAGFVTIIRRPGGPERGFRPRPFLRLTGDGLAAVRERGVNFGQE